MLFDSEQEIEAPNLLVDERGGHFLWSRAGVG
jgi:hypothetical protein